MVFTFNGPKILDDGYCLPEGIQTYQPGIQPPTIYPQPAWLS